MPSIQGRTTATRLATTNAFHGLDLVQLAYSDTTPSTTWTYDRLGRRQTATRNGVTAAMSYNSAGLLRGETCSGGTLQGLGVTNRYDAYLCRTTNGVTSGGSYLTRSRNAYDGVARLLAVGDGTVSAAYSYLADSPLVEQTTFKHDARDNHQGIRQPQPAPAPGVSAGGDGLGLVDELRVQQRQPTGAHGAGRCQPLGLWV